MYRILIHLRTQSPDIYQFLTVDGEVYGTEDIIELEEKMKELMMTMGYDDIKIVEDKDFYVRVVNYVSEDIDQQDIERLEQLLSNVGTNNLTLSSIGDYDTRIIWGKKPEDIPNKYTVEIQAPEGFVVEPSAIEVEEGETATFKITLIEEINSFHLTINDEEFTNGLPSYIEYKNGELIIKDIHNDLVVVLIKD